MSAFDVIEHAETFTIDSSGNTNETPTYDADGNLTYDGNQAYTYDAWNRLKTVAHAYRDGNTGSGTLHTGQAAVTMRYDGRGRRIGKTVVNTGSWDCAYKYYYDGDRLIETRNSGGTDGTVLRQQVWGATYVDELVQESVRTNALLEAIPDEEIPLHRASTPQGFKEFDFGSLVDYYACQDANFNVLGVVDGGGVLRERYEYTPYGERTVYWSQERTTWAATASPTPAAAMAPTRRACATSATRA